MQAAFIHSPELDTGGYPDACPFNTSRAGRTLAKVQEFDLLDGADRTLVEPRRLSRPELEVFHTPAYLDALKAAGRGELPPEQALAVGLGTPDCPIFKDMYEFIALATGASVTAAELIRDGKATIAFNPSGGFHHAQAGNAAGFCFMNDVVLAAETLAAAGKRVLFLDIDVHHCDGVQDAFYSRSDVMTISMHESGNTLFPGTGFDDEIGEGAGKGYTVNIPLPVGTYDAIYMSTFKAVVLPLIKAYDPDVIMLELGMDTLAGDPL